MVIYPYDGLAVEKGYLNKTNKGKKKMKNNSNNAIKLWSQLVFGLHTTGVRQGELLSLKRHYNYSDRNNN